MISTAAMRSNMRWWALPGEVVGARSIRERTESVVFDYDDGTLWSFRVGDEDAQAFWDHSAAALVETPERFDKAANDQFRELVEQLNAPRALVVALGRTACA